MPTLLIVEDEDKLRRLLIRALNGNAEWTTREASSAEAGIEAAKEFQPDVVLTDLRLPGMSGIDLMKTLSQEEKPPVFVVMTAYASVGSAIEALRVGALDYLVKPFPNEELIHVLDRIGKEIRLTRENKQLRSRLATYEGPEDLIGDSETIVKLRRAIAKVAPSQSTVLIRGESGTGKELIARSIHNQSGRHEAPLVRVNCGAIPENLLESELFGHVKGAFTGATEKRIGRFEMAGEGTIFLDEIGDLPLALQVKILRVLQDREYEPVGSSQTQRTEARIVAATNRDLEEAMAEGAFREDLYYRLNVVTLVAPTLREHRGDLKTLIHHFIRLVAEREGYSPKEPSPECLRAMLEWDWPGNVRELENTLEAAFVMGESDRIELEDLPGYIRKESPDSGVSVPPSSGGPVDLSTATLDDVERFLIQQALEKAGGNQSEAARRLGVTRRTLNYRREKYGI